MYFNVHLALAGAFLATTVTSASIGWRNVQEAHIAAEPNEQLVKRAPRFKFCREKNLVDCTTFDPIAKNQCCEADSTLIPLCP